MRNALVVTVSGKATNNELPINETVLEININQVKKRTNHVSVL